MNLTNHKDFIRFWVAWTTSNFGTYITSLALQVLVVVNLNGSAVDVGWINSARWLPYVFLGLAAGALLDRVNRRPVLIVTDFGRGFLLMLICLLSLYHAINLEWLIVTIIFFGAMSLFHDAASQSFLPQLVTRNLLTRANARLEQSTAVAQTSGPALAGLLVSVVGAPFAILADAISYIFSGLIIGSIKRQFKREITFEKPFGEQIKEGLRWVYRHRYLSTMALNTHFWFLFHSMVGTILVTFALTKLGFNATTFGLVLAFAGIGAVLGTSFSDRIAQYWGLGRSIAFSRILYCPASLLMVLAPSASPGVLLIQTFFIIGFGQFLYGLALGIEGPLEMGYRQSITPERLQGRMNATMRSINRSMIVIGAPLGGEIADLFGFRPALWVAILGLAIVAVWFYLSPMRNAQINDDVSM